MAFAAATPARGSVLEIERSAPDAVIEWRFDELERAGYDSLDALCVAVTTGIDLARARDLVRRGCPPALAVQILI